MAIKPGKKIDTLEIRGRVTKHKVDLRFDRATSKFHAQLGETWFEDADSRKLEERLTDAARKLEDIKFSWVIVYEISVDVWWASSRGGGHGTEVTTLGDLDDKLATPGAQVRGCHFTFHVSEVSDPVPDERARLGSTRLVREVRENAEGVLAVDENWPHERNLWWNDDKTIPYTPERYAELVRLRAALTALYSRILNVFGEGNAQVAKALDGGTKLLLTSGGGTS